MAASLLGIFTLISVIVPGILLNASDGNASPFKIAKKAGYEEPADIKLLFVGDIMLARTVELKLHEYGATYPYEQVQKLLSEPDLTIGNHEGIVPRVHKPTPPMGFQFSVEKEHFMALADAGFDVLSLANNHSHDFGTDALEHTLAICREIEILCAGSATHVGTHSVEVQEVDGVRIGFLFVQNVYQAPNMRVITELLTDLKERSDIQIAYVHWGNEYEREHDAAQEDLAKALIDEGVDAVIGHHPHVVQDVGLYKNAPIFYSLGNFIFDQYFSADVLTGAGVAMHITDEKITYTLVPFTTKDTHAQPQIMEDTDAGVLLSRIFAPIQNEEYVDSQTGIIEISRQ